ncbi:NADH dehydrogenase [ubiquinone] 1 beta subcomplex subunit 6 isoform X1 [Elgaria multicarinata webbii]|uniref:NADH dehydrogenase [ubiquinone] 1 beta subcomplex subunit 6 isoform X1 n=1 Tax=Elgaria multicarinata webbii TaxID=159646 RepID=UPI002FCCDE63
MPEGSGQGSGLVSGGAPRAALGYSPDERLRLQQLRVLRRRWLKDQELSPREPVLPPRKPGLVEGFWERFLQPGGFWRNQVFKTYNAGKFFTVRLLIPLWLVHYYVKYHITAQPYGIVESKRMLFPGDKILETDEVVPPLEVPSSHH